MNVSSNFRYVFMLLVCCIAFFGCDSQKNFKPDIVKGKITFNGQLEKPLVASNKINARLKNNRILINNTSFSNLFLSSNENLLYEDSKFWIIADGCKQLEVVPIHIHDNVLTLDRESKKLVETNGCIVAASIKGNLVAGVFGDNTLFLYDLDSNDFILREKGEPVYAISSIVPSPVFLDTLIVFSTLNGSLSTVDIGSRKIVKNIIINSDKFLNNIEYLKINNDEMVASTQKRLYTLIRGESYTKDIEIRDIYFDGVYIYVLSLNGIIYKLDKNLAEIKKVKLPYASLYGIIIKDNILYTLENSSGYIIELNLNDFSYNTFKLAYGTDRWFSKRATIFYANNTFFINKRVLDINKEYRIEFKKVKTKKIKKAKRSKKNDE